MDRLPFQATLAGAGYEHIAQLPVAVLLDNVRSLYNVGSFFRTADAAACEKLYLCGITGRPPKPAISKTALGAEETVSWEHHSSAGPLIEQLRRQGIAAQMALADVGVYYDPHFLHLFFFVSRLMDTGAPGAVRSAPAARRERRRGRPARA